jgi:hypothetical protein
MTDPQPLPRRRGAPRGNHNAVKHGFYSRQFHRSDIQDLNNHQFIGLNDEIDLLRVSIRRVMDRYKTDATLEESLEILRTISLASICLTRLLRTNKLIAEPESNIIRMALHQVVTEMGFGGKEDGAASMSSPRSSEELTFSP